VATDFRDGKTFPRRGRQELGGFVWLARVTDKARAKAAGTIDGYIYPCPMDRGAFKRWGIEADDFSAAIAANPTDDGMLAWVRERVPETNMQAANTWVLAQTSNLDWQDADEGVPGAKTGWRSSRGAYWTTRIGMALITGAVVYLLLHLRHVR
jgi:hypothetical protein